MSKRDPQHILVVKNRAMGDAIIGLGTIQYLRELYPDAKITYAVPSWIAPLFSKVETACDEILGFSLKGIKDWYAFYREIEKRDIDCVFEMFQSGRTAKFFNLLWHIKGIDYLFHNHHQKTESLIKDQGVIKANIQRDLDGAWSHFARIHGHDCPLYINYSPEMKIPSGPPAASKDQIIFGVVATRKTKMWDLDRYVELAKLIKEKSPNTKIIIPLSKSQMDLEIKKELEEMAIDGEIIQAPLSDLPQIFAGSKFYVGNDTGIKHLCVALDIKTYTLFGPEPPTEWHPYDFKLHPYFYLDDLECRTREAHYCGLSTCPDMTCLKEFSPSDVFSKLDLK